MKANELRIGNWVVIDNGERPKYYHCVTAHDIEEIDGCGDDCFPIPLTPEILVKNKFNIGGPKCVGIVYEMLEYPGYWEYKEAKIQFVHQLQNLYFALTGKELQIEL